MSPQQSEGDVSSYPSRGWGVLVARLAKNPDTGSRGWIGRDPLLGSPAATKGVIRGMKVRHGQRFIVTEDHLVQGLTHWRAPFTGGFERTIPAGTVVIARYDQHPTAPAFDAVPEDYEGLEEVLISPEDRSHGKYDGYSLTLFEADIGDWLRGAVDG